ncbi:peptidase inhibitor 16-like isoform X5 [Ambystoma mexicanum]|uniref:peptidase inhibitor 16-like isoform X5 n=1 Tax=Ambystoma mexicanum TaxID=8296 RepID=UPI0037E6F839
MRASGLPLLPLLLLIIALLPRGLYLREDFHTWWDKNDPPAYNDPVFIDRMLNEHNRLRAMVEPPASDMLYLVVWGNTYKLGCAAHVCDSVKGFDGEYYMIVLCNYGPAGNYPHQPYTSGASCTACPAGDKCENKLCRNPTRDTMDRLPFTPTDKKAKGGTETKPNPPSGKETGSQKAGTGSASGSASGGHAGTETGGHAAERADVSKASLPLDHLVLHVLLFNCCYTLFYLVYQ